MLLPYIKINRIDLSMEGAIQRPPKTAARSSSSRSSKKTHTRKKEKLKHGVPRRTNNS